MNFVALWFVYLPTRRTTAASWGSVWKRPRNQFLELRTRLCAYLLHHTISHASCLVSILSPPPSPISSLVSLLPVRYTSLNNGRVIPLMHRPRAALPYAALTVPTITNATATALYLFFFHERSSMVCAEQKCHPFLCSRNHSACASLPSHSESFLLDLLVAARLPSLESLLLVGTK